MTSTTVKRFDGTACIVFFIILQTVPSAWSQIHDLRPFKNVDPTTILMSPEYTFQDQNMVDEKGRLTMKTPHKLQKLKDFSTSYLEDRNLKFEQNSRANLNAFKAGYFLKLSENEA